MSKEKKFGQPYKAELKRLSKELLVAKKKVQETFVHSVSQNEGRCWTSSISILSDVKEIEKIIPMTKDLMVLGHQNELVIIGKLVTDPTEKVNSLTAYYASLFSCERNNPQIKSIDSGKPFTISINIVRKRLSAIGRKKLVEPGGIPGEILK